MRKGNPFFIALFLGGIVLPSLVLSFLSFRSIRSESLLAEKKYEEDIKNFQRAIAESVDRGVNHLLQETRRRSLYLFDQPASLEELERSEGQQPVPALNGISLFNQGKQVYPLFSGGGSSFEISQLPPDPTEVELLREERHGGQSPVLEQFRLRRSRTTGLSPEQNLQNKIGLLRIAWKRRKPAEVLRLANELRQYEDSPSYLQTHLGPSVELMRFRALIMMREYEQAMEDCRSLLREFLLQDNHPDLDGAAFLFESMLDDILSLDFLSDERRESFWNLRHNLREQIRHAQLLKIHRSTVEHLRQLQYHDRSGLNFVDEGSQVIFRMSHPWLPGEQAVIGFIDAPKFYRDLLYTATATAREWRQVQYALVDAHDSILLARKTSENMQEHSRHMVSVGFPDWRLILYHRDAGEFRRESRNRMLLLYSLVGFSLLILLLGTGFVMQGVAQERRLLSMKANFLSSISHELKTPLTSIKMFSEMMARGRVQKPEKIGEYSTLISKEANRLETLIQAILDFTRLEHGKAVFRWETLDLAQVTEKVLVSLREIARGKGLEFLEELQPNSLIQGDYTALHSLVQNLVDNAIKYTPAPGTIQVQVNTQENSIVLSVIDTGVGIPVSEQKNIFNDFYRVGDEMTRTTKGSGLGLAIVRRVAESHRAALTVQSRLQKGSTFTVRFKKVENEQNTDS